VPRPKKKVVRAHQQFRQATPPQIFQISLADNDGYALLLTIYFPVIKECFVRNSPPSHFHFRRTTDELCTS
jgi:hypothetical protein